MLEYKVETLKIKQMEERINELAKDGWKVVAQSPNISGGNPVKKISLLA